ncbi:ACT domain-containing protein [Rhizomonospora bruguierae]|uniref:ACT domain-containing protein n=1 Tax=Rhizomonospora bruguierae TaxID=1581705 RepID=UPI001BCF4569|nr:ACT domain-containing protein [Micromonospora sp. NBRC 107566]
MLDLDLLPDEYAVCRLPAGTAVPDPTGDGAAILSVTWTPDEVSVICAADRVPAGAGPVEPGWRCLRVVGPLDLALTGVLASLAGPLAEARVNIFVFSTFDTDYVLVPAVRLAEAVAALTGAGHRIAAGTP